MNEGVTICSSRNTRRRSALQQYGFAMVLFFISKYCCKASSNAKISPSNKTSRIQTPRYCIRVDYRVRSASPYKTCRELRYYLKSVVSYVLELALVHANGRLPIADSPREVGRRGRRLHIAGNAALLATIGRSTIITTLCCASRGKRAVDC